MDGMAMPLLISNISRTSLREKICELKIDSLASECCADLLADPPSSSLPPPPPLPTQLQFVLWFEEQSGSRLPLSSPLLPLEPTRAYVVVDDGREFIWRLAYFPNPPLYASPRSTGSLAVYFG